MNTNRSAASLKPQFLVVIQFTTLSGMWSRKIAQLAIPRNRSSRRSRPLSGKVALIFMGAVFDMKRPSGTGSGRVSGSVARQVVTGRHNEYTILADVSSQAGESTIQARDAYPG